MKRKHLFIVLMGSLLATGCQTTGTTQPADEPRAAGQAGHAHMHDDHAVHAGGDIGAVDFEVACDTAVQGDFDRALGLMHHMMYAQARSEFENIAEADPECAMAHWGIATTLFQPLWGTRPSDEELNQGWEAIQRAQELAETERERSLIHATAEFFREPDTADFPIRIERWATGMEEAFEQYPDDADTAALYALSRLTLAQQVEERDPLHDEAEAILRRIHERKPQHPGAIHYSIHATDADGRAENALDMVEAYADIAPEVPHALHMPSHIYVRLGDWPAVIHWNRRSADAALDHPVNGDVSHHYIHALDYLVYAYLQRGEDGRARAVFEELADEGPHQQSFVSAFHFAAMPARYVVEQRRWEDAVALEARSPAYLPWDESAWAEGLTWFAKGLGAVRTGDAEIARLAERRLASLRDQARDEGDEHFATYLEVDRLILAGTTAHAHGRAEQAEEHMRSAASLERTVEKHPVTPGALLPPNEALGDLLMAQDRPADALAAYQASDDIWPGRYNTLLGAARAAVAADRAQAASEYYGRLVEQAGDSDRPSLEEARRYLERGEIMTGGQ